MGRPSSDLQPTAYGLQPSSRSGVALVMVLGILSVMVIMAVAFAIAMRTERVAAGNYADSVRARQLVQVGLARALNDIAVNLGTNGLASAVGGTNYPPWTVTNSYTTTYTNTSTNAFLFQLLVTTNGANEATNFVPRALWAAATNADCLNATNHWLLATNIVYTNDATKSYPVFTNILGRVSYLILNCSGLLDANFAGGAARGMGTNPCELAISNMPEFSDASKFLLRRDTGSPPPPDYRYETLEELAMLNASSFNGAPTNFMVYSYALPGYWVTNTVPGTVGNQANLAGSVANLILNQANIFTAFTNSGLSSLDAWTLFSNLVDYVDSDSIPSNLTTCVEAVPMINEVLVSNVVTVVGSATAGNASYTITPYVYVECWYPFVTNTGASGPFTLKSSITFSAQNVMPPTGVSISPSVSLSSVSSGACFIVTGFSCGPYTYNDIPSVPSVTLISSITLSIALSNTVVDQVQITPIALTNMNSGAVGTYTTYADMECLDPRFNSNPSDANQWQQMGNTNNLSLGVQNTWTKSFLLSANDGDTAMYVANTNLQSVAELGCLAYAPWKTVKLYGASCQRVLDFFAIGTNATYTYVTNTSWRGRVNPNTPGTDVLPVVFSNMPLDEYPGQVGASPIPPTEAKSFVTIIQNNGPYTNLSDVGRKLIANNFPPSADNELKKEAIFRNTCNLLSMRQNLFTIIIKADVASGGNIPRNPVCQRAVALVWRDPYTGEMFVRSIKWLKD